MTIHVLIQCSKKKSFDFPSEMAWGPKTTLEYWNTNWEKQKAKTDAEKLYSGRSIKREFEFISSMENVEGYIISAGAGLAKFSEKIPSYESTFSNGNGPNYSQWRQLPLGGLSNIIAGENDAIVSFAAPNYHRAIKADPIFEKLASKFVVASTSPLSSHQDVTSVEIHPRTAELLKVAYIDLNSELLNQYLNGGIKRLEEVYQGCEKLPPMEQRRTISDEDLLALIESFESISSIANSVKYIRHTLGISASYERTRDAIHQLR
jgi:hypothetical protein